jgi:hypothetical protein
VVLSSLDDLPGERVLLDPNEIDDSGSTIIDWYQPSPDGGLVAVSLSSLDQRVSELADIYAFLFDRLGVHYRPAADRDRLEG